MTLQRTKETIVKQMDYINYSDLRKAVEKLLSEREGRKVDIRDYAGHDEARRAAFIEIDKLGDRSWYSTRYDQYTPVQQKQHDIYEAATKDIPRQDFWLFWFDWIDTDVSNDTTKDVGWDYEGTVEYITEEKDEEEQKYLLTILAAFNEVLLEAFTQEELDNGIQIHYSW